MLEHQKKTHPLAITGIRFKHIQHSDLRHSEPESYSSTRWTLARGHDDDAVAWSKAYAPHRWLGRYQLACHVGRRVGAARLPPASLELAVSKRTRDGQPAMHLFGRQTKKLLNCSWGQRESQTKIGGPPTQPKHERSYHMGLGGGTGRRSCIVRRQMALGRVRDPRRHDVTNSTCWRCPKAYLTRFQRHTRMHSNNSMGTTGWSSSTHATCILAMRATQPATSPYLCSHIFMLYPVAAVEHDLSTGPLYPLPLESIIWLVVARYDPASCLFLASAMGQTTDQFHDEPAQGQYNQSYMVRPSERLLYR